MRALAAALALAAAACGGVQQNMAALATQKYMEGDYPEALHWAENAIIRGNATPLALAQAYYTKAQVLDRLNRRSEAAGLYEYLVRFAPGTETSFLAQARLDVIGPACKVSAPP